MLENSKVYDVIHRTVELKLEKNNLKRKLVQDGIKGSFICEQCESKISDLENYSSKFFKRDNFYRKANRKTIPDKNNSLKEITYYELYGFDFKKIQKFLLSIYLRQHFYNLSIGNNPLIISKHLGVLLKLYNETAIDYYTYPIAIYHMQPSDKLKGGGIVYQPYVCKMDGHYTLQFYAVDFYFILDISSHLGLFPEEFILKPAGLLMVSVDSYEIIMRTLKNSVS
ncbi:MAG: hypothetical protein OXK80_04325 [Bdellovibrionales bacterium]|nr:hypothetical protein [Bdellovibrionales bacterium]